MIATVIVALITAIAAVIAPVISSAIKSRSAERIKQLELVEANKYQAVSEIAKGYSELKEHEGYLDPVWNFFTAAYKILALFKDENVQSCVIELVTALRNSNGRIDAKTDDQFDKLLVAISCTQVETKKSR